MIVWTKDENTSGKWNPKVHSHTSAHFTHTLTHTHNTHTHTLTHTHNTHSTHTHTYSHAQYTHTHSYSHAQYTHTHTHSYSHAQYTHTHTLTHTHNTHTHTHTLTHTHNTHTHTCMHASTVYSTFYTMLVCMVILVNYVCYADQVLDTFSDVMWHASWSITGDILAVSGGDNKVSIHFLLM